MTGLDTNVIVRYLAQDDARQSALATHLVEQELSDRQPGFISLVVLVETGWVLRRAYAATEGEWRATVRDLLDTRQFAVERRDLVDGALTRLGEGGGDFADALIAEAAAAAGCDRTVSFDRGAVRLGMTLLR